MIQLTPAILFFFTTVWVASVVAVLIISAVSLLGLALVPLVNKAFYNEVIQFLVALAVGCLTGDAFLHLLPHVSPSEKDSNATTPSHLHGILVAFIQQTSGAIVYFQIRRLCPLSFFKGYYQWGSTFPFPFPRR